MIPRRPWKAVAGGVVLAGAVIALCPACGRGSGSPAAPPAAPDAPAVPAGRERLLDAPEFDCELIDISARTGIAFRHATGGFGEKLLPETMGAGCALLDFDGDGAIDVFFVNGASWPGRAPDGAPAPACALYRGRGDGTFEDVTAAAGAGVTLQGMGASVADFDGDLDDDLFVTGVDRNVLLRNDSGSFVDVTRAAGVETRTWRDRDGADRPEWSTASVWADLDQDGDVDLVVGNYVEWSVTGEIFTTLDGVMKAFTTPDRYRGLPCRLFASRGDGTFEEATGPSGMGAFRGKALGLALWDFDGNGLLDLVVANDTQPNFLFLNLGNLRFREVGLSAGIAYDETGRARAGMGIDIADYMNAGLPGIVISNFTEEPVSLFRWQPDGTFSSEATRAGIAQPTYENVAFGVRFVDVDLDGVQDLVIANGHIEPDVARTFPNQTYLQSPQLFHGRAFGRFEDVSTRAGADFLAPRAGRGLASGDLDGDGDLDLILTTSGGAPVVFQNVRRAAPPRHHLRVRLHGKGKNTRALGAVVRLTAGGITQTRTARTGSSYLSESERVLTFGLGASTAVERLEIRWPGDRTVTVPVTEIDRTIEVRED